MPSWRSTGSCSNSYQLVQVFFLLNSQVVISHFSLNTTSTVQQSVFIFIFFNIYWLDIFIATRPWNSIFKFLKSFFIIRMNVQSPFPPYSFSPPPSLPVLRVPILHFSLLIFIYFFNTFTNWERAMRIILERSQRRVWE